MSIIVFFVIGVLAVSCKAGCVLGDLGSLLSLGTVIFFNAVCAVWVGTLQNGGN